MNIEHKALHQIIGECDSFLLHTRPNMPYRGLAQSGLRDGIEIIRKLATDGIKRRNRSNDSSSPAPRKRS